MRKKFLLGYKVGNYISHYFILIRKFFFQTGLGCVSLLYSHVIAMSMQKDQFTKFADAENTSDPNQDKVVVELREKLRL